MPSPCTLLGAAAADDTLRHLATAEHTQAKARMQSLNHQLQAARALLDQEHDEQKARDQQRAELARLEKEDQQTMENLRAQRNKPLHEAAGTLAELPNDTVHNVVTFLELTDLGRLGMTETRMWRIAKHQKDALLGNPALAWMAKKYKQKLRLPFVHFGRTLRDFGGVHELTALHKFSMRQVVVYDDKPWATTREGAMLEFAKYECAEQFYTSDEAGPDGDFPGELAMFSTHGRFHPGQLAMFGTHGIIRVTFGDQDKLLWAGTRQQPRGLIPTCCWIRDQLNRKLQTAEEAEAEATSDA